MGFEERRKFYDIDFGKMLMLMNMINKIMLESRNPRWSWFEL